MQTVNPAPNQLFCKPEEAIKKTTSGILLTTEAAQKPRVAEVINIGSLVKGFQAEDKIVYKMYSTNEIKLNNADFFLIAEEDVLGTIVEVE